MMVGKKAVFPIVIVFLLAGIAFADKYSGGTGEPNNPYQIATPDDLNYIGNHPEDYNKCFVLVNDIDLGAYTGSQFNIIGSGFGPSMAFTGVFDGKGHTVRNFTFVSPGSNFVGLFGVAGWPGTEAAIRDLGVSGVNIDAGSGERVGGLVGFLVRGRLSRCYVEAGNVSGGMRVGGLVGTSWGEVSNCYSTVSVTGTSDVGGLLGYNYSGAVLNCYAAGTVVGVGSHGGLIGERYEGWVISSYWDIDASGLTESAGGSGKTHIQMRTASTFVSWGCDGPWKIDEANDYPRLLWEDRQGEPITNKPSYGGGTGEPSDPYLIYTAEQLNMVGLTYCDWDQHFRLMADIDLGGLTGGNFNIIGNWRRPFSGIFDGNSRTISNFTSTGSESDFVGLFGTVSGNDAQINNLGLVEPNIAAPTNWYVGPLVGYLSKGIISDCFVQDGKVEGYRFVGGLIGYNESGNILGCRTSGIVECVDTWTGGLVGLNNSGRVFYCYSSASVSTGYQEAAGLVGRNDEGIISGCCSSGSISGVYRVGGLGVCLSNRF